MFQQLHATILIFATLLAQCAPWCGPVDALPSIVDAGNSPSSADDRVLPEGMPQVAVIRLITSQTIQLGRTERASDESDPSRLLPGAADLSPPGYLLTDSGRGPGNGRVDFVRGPAMDRNPTLRL
ncbi:MAG: hypothetical protein ACF8TS_04330 [Maioricimonas sp. JB049]